MFVFFYYNWYYVLLYLHEAGDHGSSHLPILCSTKQCLLFTLIFRPCSNIHSNTHSPFSFAPLDFTMTCEFNIFQALNAYYFSQKFKISFFLSLTLFHNLHIPSPRLAPWSGQSSFSTKLLKSVTFIYRCVLVYHRWRLGTGNQIAESNSNQVPCIRTHYYPWERFEYITSPPSYGWNSSTVSAI